MREAAGRANPPASPAPESESKSTRRSDSSAAQTLAPPVHVAPLPAPKLGTGHGDREVSYVSHTEFSRMQPQPNEVIRIRYDSLDNLFAMGIIKRPRPATPAANPFPASPEQQYVPDPRG